jgi:hypothetical protein
MDSSVIAFVHMFIYKISRADRLLNGIAGKGDLPRKLQKQVNG